jgi:hypothetical protein
MTSRGWERQAVLGLMPGSEHPHGLSDRDYRIVDIAHPWRHASGMLGSVALAPSPHRSLGVTRELTTYDPRAPGEHALVRRSP